jgi:hypothetical protein
VIATEGVGTVAHITQEFLSCRIYEKLVYTTKQPLALSPGLHLERSLADNAHSRFENTKPKFLRFRKIEIGLWLSTQTTKPSSARSMRFTCRTNRDG